MPVCWFPLFLCIVHLRRASYLSLVFSGSLHSVESIFPFLLCLSLLSFPQLFVKSPQTITLPSCISFSLEKFGHCLLYSVMNLFMVMNFLYKLIYKHMNLFWCYESGRCFLYQISSLDSICHLHCIIIRDLI